jgi:hypothetical protein
MFIVALPKNKTTYFLAKVKSVVSIDFVFEYSMTKRTYMALPCNKPKPLATKLSIQPQLR